jgi:hypothetical protein
MCLKTPWSILENIEETRMLMEPMVGMSVSQSGSTVKKAGISVNKCLSYINHAR